jgi:transposase InsO family protein
MARTVLRGRDGGNAVLLPDFLHDWATPREARQSLGQFIHTYNERRLHQSLGYRPPAEVYFTRAAA